MNGIFADFFADEQSDSPARSAVMAKKTNDYGIFREIARLKSMTDILEIFSILQSRHMPETDCLQKIIEFSFLNKYLFTYMLYDTSIEETRCMKNLRTAHNKGFEEQDA